MNKVTRMSGQYEPEDVVDSAGALVERRCTFCGVVKPITEFYRNGMTPTGEVAYRQDCKTCYNIRIRENHNKKAHTDFIGSQRRRGETAPTLTHQEWKECLIFFGGECAYCGCTARKGQRMTKDHLVPIAAGGRTIQSNIVPACPKCNSSKGAEDFKAWFMAQSFFNQERLNRIFRWRTIIRQTESGDM